MAPPSASAQHWQWGLVVATLLLSTILLANPSALREMAVRRQRPRAQKTAACGPAGAALAGKTTAVEAPQQSGVAGLLANAFPGAFVEWSEYSASLPEAHLDKGIVSSGATARTRRLVHRLLAGEQLKVAALGGSVTWGKAVDDRETHVYGALVTTWLQRSFPTANLKFINA